MKDWLAGLGLLGERRYRELNGWEPKIPTALEDWDADYERVTGHRCPYAPIELNVWRQHTVTWDRTL